MGSAQPGGRSDHSHSLEEEAEAEPDNQQDSAYHRMGSGPDRLGTEQGAYSLRSETVGEDSRGNDWAATERV